MTVPSMIDLVMSLCMFMHVGNCAWWLHGSALEVMKVLNHPFRNDVAKAAVKVALPLWLVGSLCYGVVLWRFKAFLDIYGGEGISEIVLLIFLSIFSVFSLGRYLLFKFILIHAQLLGIQK